MLNVEYDKRDNAILFLLSTGIVCQLDNKFGLPHLFVSKNRTEIVLCVTTRLN